MSVESCFENFPSWTFKNFDTTKLGERHCEWRFFSNIYWQMEDAPSAGVILFRVLSTRKKWCVFVLLLPTKENVPLRGEGLGFAYDLGSGKKLTEITQRGWDFPRWNSLAFCRAQKLNRFVRDFTAARILPNFFMGDQVIHFWSLGQEILASEFVKPGCHGIKSSKSNTLKLAVTKLLKLLAIPRKGKNDLKR